VFTWTAGPSVTSFRISHLSKPQRTCLHLQGKEEEKHTAGIKCRYTAPAHLSPPIVKKNRMSLSSTYTEEPGGETRKSKKKRIKYLRVPLLYTYPCVPFLTNRHSNTTNYNARRCNEFHPRRLRKEFLAPPPLPFLLSFLYLIFLFHLTWQRWTTARKKAQGEFFGIDRLRLCIYGAVAIDLTRFE
jgi:hypothetical protein